MEFNPAFRSLALDGGVMTAYYYDKAPPANVEACDTFLFRHLGSPQVELDQMLTELGYRDLDALSNAAVPKDIRRRDAITVGPALGERELIKEMKYLFSQNTVMRSLIGQGYYDTSTPGVILRNVLENPGWYTQYTPYQAEISQGRLEALLNFQTMIADLTGLPMANSSLLDEATAAAEAINMVFGSVADAVEQKRVFLVSDQCHPQTLAVVKTRTRWQGVDCRVVADILNHPITPEVCGVLVQYPDTSGNIFDHTTLVNAVHAVGGLVVVATDLLALTLLKPPGEWGADIVVGSAQRFGVPMGYGGPHAAFMATRPEFVRKMPGRLVGVSKDANGQPALRLSLQTREQHIRRDKATSNICTAQVLLAIMASMYAQYHGPAGLRRIALRVQALMAEFATNIRGFGHIMKTRQCFDTVRFEPIEVTAEELSETLRKHNYNVRLYGDNTVGVSFDETTTDQESNHLIRLCCEGRLALDPVVSVTTRTYSFIPPTLQRTSAFLTHPAFNLYHSETEMLRYIKRLESRDLSLTQSMIPLGSCTMKLNATVEMLPVTWPEVSQLHPYAPKRQARGYTLVLDALSKALIRITGLSGCSLQPNAGSQGEYAGLITIRAYLEAKGQGHRNICLIPTSAHGTNPASAVVAGLTVVPVACDAEGNIDLQDLRAQAQAHAENLACLMITYPSTHGVFEANIKEVTRTVHAHGGQVYLDGANMNAQVCVCRPREIGADVCHINLHKTFCIPHGGGGPGMGPICVAKHLVPYLPCDPLAYDAKTAGAVSAAKFGSASILPISYAYICAMGTSGLRMATQVAILNANYMRHRLETHYPILFKGPHGLCAHEFIIDLRPFEASAGIKTEDVAKRLMDYGFHAPTMSWPVPGTLMIEPTESESKAELDRFCDAMIAIRQEIQDIADGKLSRTDNPLKHAPHTAAMVCGDTWTHGYSRQQAAYPAPWLKAYKFWPAVARIDNPYGDRNLVCSCVGMDALGN